MKKTLAMLLCLVMLLGMMAACGDDTTADESEAPAASDSSQDNQGNTGDDGGDDANEPSGSTDRTLSIGTTYSHLYLFTAGAGESDNYGRSLVYDQLFYIDDDTGERVSDIISNYEWEDDTTLRLDLKDGILFADGTQMKGEDILYTLKLYVDTQNSELEFFQRINFDASYVADDGLTTYIVYNEVYGPALNTLCVPVLSKTFCEEHADGDDAWWYSPLGSGPYEVGEVVMGTSVEYVLRDDYWNTDKTYEAETITIYYYSDTTAQYADYTSGKLDAIIDLSSTQVDQLSTLDNTKVVTQSADDVLMLAFNESTVPAAVREAVAYAVDWDAVALAAFGSLYKSASSHFATTFDAYTNHAGTYSYDKEKAQQILADAGVEGLTLTMPCYGGSTDEVIGEALQFYLSEIGITLVIEPMDIPTLIPALINGDGDIGFQNAGSGNPQKEVNTAVSPLAVDGFKIMSISDAGFNDMLNRGLGTIDDAERAAIYKEVDQWLYDNYQAIPILEKAVAFCYNSEKLSGMAIASVQRGCVANVTFN